MNTMNIAWSVLKGDEEFRIDTRINSGDRQKFGVKGLNPDDVPTSVPRAIQQSRPVNINRRTRGRPGYRSEPVARLQGEGADAGEEGVVPGNFYGENNIGSDDQGKTQSRGRHMRDGRSRRRRNEPTIIDVDDDEEVGDFGADVDSNLRHSQYHNYGADINDVGQQVQASPRPTVGQVDDLSRQAEGGMRAQTSGFQSKPYGRFMNRQPKMGPAGIPVQPKGRENAFALDPRLSPVSSFPKNASSDAFIESWGTLLKESMCKGKDCEGCRGCKSCPKCKPKGSTCEKEGC